ncbi:MAG: hypothetical protein JSU60_06120 [Nitrospirota bacterium]|nr:MAG: hypothetical protein JSU60_06120 [Nitrospirota bacterium]
MKSQTRAIKPSKKPTKLSSPRKRAVNAKTLQPKQAPIYAFTFKDASRLSGVRLTTLRRWLLEKKIMRRKDGAFNVTELLQLGARENETCGGSMRSSKAERARDLYWERKALEKSLDVKIKQGELIDRETVVQELVLRETVFKNRLLGLADILASRLVGLGADRCLAGEVTASRNYRLACAPFGEGWPTERYLRERRCS